MIEGLCSTSALSSITPRGTELCVIEESGFIVVFNFCFLSFFFFYPTSKNLGLLVAEVQILSFVRSWAGDVA